MPKRVTQNKAIVDRESEMSLEYLLVSFSETRNVLADGVPVGITNRIILIAAGVYAITLDGNPTAPPSQNVTLNGTSVATPCVLHFT